MADEVKRPKVALIGRPNVGKSTLFNRLIGREARRGGRAAIVDKKPGITRDRLYGVCEWDGYEFTVIDCGGIGPESEDPLLEEVADNAREAIREADLVIFITDGRSGLTLSDDAVLKELRGKKKQVLVAVNKVDSEKQEPDAYEYYKLGYPDLMFIAAQSGRLIGDLLDLVVERIHWEKWPEATPAFAAKRYGGEDEAAGPLLTGNEESKPETPLTQESEKQERED
ncbi:50S ribosome-binding GTPase [bacterium]|nr:50S ribosome-binding GTPase [bacterium]